MLVSEEARLISDILEITDLLKIKGLLLILFDSVDHQFLSKVLKTFGFGKTLLNG